MTMSYNGLLVVAIYSIIALGPLMYYFTSVNKNETCSDSMDTLNKMSMYMIVVSIFLTIFLFKV